MINGVEDLQTETSCWRRGSCKVDSLPFPNFPAHPRQNAFQCDPEDQTSGIILLSLGAMGVGANAALMGVLLSRAHLRR